MTAPTRPDRAVVVAFGPADATRAAVDRARRLLPAPAPVTVVPAHRGTAPDGVAPVGTAALRAALPDDDRPTLALHDDVHIGRDGAGALLRAWRATGAIAVPWMSAAGPSHDVGVDVPADAGARARLARRLPLRGADAPVVRTACLLGAGAQLRALADRFVTVAEGQWSDPAVTTVVAAGALAHHADACRAPAAAPVDGPLLVAALIVRDEAATLPDCLASLDGVVDRIEVCDTGSTDATVAIAEAAGAHVRERRWRDDFAWARNAVLEHCRDAVWILQIDADERVRCDDPAALRGLLARLADSATVCAVPIDNLADDGTVGSTHQGARILRVDGLRYEGALHERARYGADEPVAFTLPGIRLDHHGYREQVLASRHKAERNLAISEAAYAAAPGWETAFNLARSLSMAPTGDARVAALLDETLAGGDAVPLTWRAWALAWLGRHQLDRDAEAAAELAGRALALVPADPVAGAVLAEAADRLGRHDLVLDQRAARRTTSSARPFVELAAASARVADHEIASLLAHGQTDEAYDEAVAAFRRDPGRFRAWPALVRSVAGADDVAGVDDLLVSAALRDATGGCVAAFAGALPPARTARLCARYLQGGGGDARAVRDGLATAIVAGDAATARELLGDAHRLEQPVLARLAAAAGQRGVDGIAGALDALATAPRRRFVVVGCPGSQLAATAAALTAIGHPCGHEAVHTAAGAAADHAGLQGDASWYALPDLDALPGDAVILHQVRDPLDVVAELRSSGTLRPGTPAHAFVGAHAPHVVAHDDEADRCMDLWVTWNTRLARHADGGRPYVRYRVTDLDAAALAEVATLLGSDQPAAAVERRVGVAPAAAAAVDAAAPALPDGPLADRVHALAVQLGCARTPVA